MSNLVVFAVVMSLALAGASFAFSAIAVYHAKASSGVIEHMLRPAPPPKPSKAVTPRKRENMA